MTRELYIQRITGKCCSIIPENVKMVCVALIMLLSSMYLKGQTDVCFGIPHGEYTYTVNTSQSYPGMGVLTTSSVGNVSFADFGRKMVNHYTENTDPGEVMLRSTKNYCALRLPGYYCLMNSDTREIITEEDLTATTEEVLAWYSITDYDNLTGTTDEIYTSQYVGTTTYLGRTCRKYKITEKTPLYGSVDWVIVWNNIVMERTSNTSYVKYEFKVTKLDETVPHASIFQITKEQ